MLGYINYIKLTVKVNYRPEIDGLRAIAVFSVIIYHARDSFLPGGFLGVDIFFVISGYLITSLILKELKLTNSFSFSNFYERRVRRIIPALLAVMIFSTCISYFALLPTSFDDFSRSLISSIFSVSNFYFHYTDNLYAAESSLLKPLMHTWSLSVEEQFYIIFPITIFAIYKFSRKNVFLAIIFGIIVSLIFAQYYSIRDTSINFYLLPSRGFELLLGSLLAKLEVDKGVKIRNSNLLLSKIFPSIGLIFIFFSLFLFNNRMLLPSLHSLVPIIGTMLIIWYSNKDEIITKILSNRVLVFFGLISYSLYLFHYPIFAFSRYLNLLEGDLLKRILLLVSLLSISILSYFFIEKPFRNKKLISLSKLCITLIITIAGLVFFNIYAIYKDGFKQRLHKILQEELHFAEKINYNTNGNKGSVVLIGDSHIESIEYHLNQELIKENINLSLLYTQLFAKNINKYDSRTNQIDKEFASKNLEIEKYLNREKNLILVLHHRWSVMILSTDFPVEKGVIDYKLKPTSDKITEERRISLVRKSIISSINSALEKKHKVILVYPVPEHAFDAPRLIYNKLNKFLKISINDDDIPKFSTNYDLYKKRNRLIFKTLDSIKGNNVYRVYPHKHFCDNQIKNECVTNSTDTLYYYDNNHLSLQGSKFVVKDIIEIIKKINSKQNN